MIKGRYELKIFFDVDRKRLKKELTMSDDFKHSEEFVKKLLSDLQAAGPLIDRYIPTLETEKEDPTEESEDADI